MHSFYLSFTYTISHYVRCDVVLLGMGESDYLDEAYQNDIAIGSRVSLDISSVQARFPPQANMERFKSAYVNHDGGWSNATAGTAAMLSKVRKLGGQVLEGKEVLDLVYDDSGEISSVRLGDGEELKADFIVIATGAWTPSIFAHADLGLAERLTAAGCVFRHYTIF